MSLLLIVIPLLTPYLERASRPSFNETPPFIATLDGESIPPSTPSTQPHISQRKPWDPPFPKSPEKVKKRPSYLALPPLENSPFPSFSPSGELKDAVSTPAKRIPQDRQGKSIEQEQNQDLMSPTSHVMLDTYRRLPKPPLPTPITPTEVTGDGRDLGWLNSNEIENKGDKNGTGDDTQENTPPTPQVSDSPALATTTISPLKRTSQSFAVLSSKKNPESRTGIVSPLPQRRTIPILYNFLLVLGIVVAIFAFVILIVHCLAWFIVYKTEARLGEVWRGVVRGGEMRVCLCAK